GLGGRRWVLLSVAVALMVGACSGQDSVVPEPEFDDLVWTVHDPWVVNPDDPIRLATFAATGDTVLAGGFDSDGGFFLAESTDRAESWSSASSEVAWTVIRGWSFDSAAVLAGSVGSQAAVYATGNDGSDWSLSYLDDIHTAGSIPTAATVDGDRWIVVGMRGDEGNDYPVMWRSDDAGGSWESVALPTAPGVRSVVSSVGASGRSIVVGGLIKLRESGLFPDGALRKAVVWVSSNGGDSWDEIVLDSLDAPEARVRLVVVTDDGFRAIGTVTDLAWRPGDTPDLAQWSTGDDMSEWAPSTMAEPGRQRALAVLANSADVYVVGQSVPDGESYRLAIWQSTAHGLVKLREFVLPNGNLLSVAGAIRVGDTWLLAGTRDDGEAFPVPSANWLIVGEPQEPEGSPTSPSP
ncbi:MAG: hypothetical protein GY788_28480, partial [bacterium]|nr:hypothetical protein [bacterium]